MPLLEHADRIDVTTNAIKRHPTAGSAAMEIVKAWEGELDEQAGDMVLIDPTNKLEIAALRLLDAERAGDERRIDKALEGLSGDEVWQLSEGLERAMSTCKYRLEIWDD